jgi:hypothetical protein
LGDVTHFDDYPAIEKRSESTHNPAKIIVQTNRTKRDVRGPNGSKVSFNPLRTGE